jgi:hypothetical protein
MIWKVLKNRSNEILSNEIRIRRELPVFCSIKMCPCTTYLYIMTLATVLQHDRDYSEEYPQSNICCYYISSTSLQSYVREVISSWKPLRLFYLTDYGHPERVFFQNPKLLGLGRQIRPKFFGAFWVFSAKLSAPILVQ